jgi:hypothetical protein
MLRPVAATVEFYEQVLSAFPDTESLTVLVASGVTRDAVLAGLGADLSSPVEDAWDTDERSTAWAAVEVPGGVVAVELSGYGDPSLAILAALSKAGAAAVVRGNIQAHHRFGCARAGELAFDDDEFIYLDDPGRVPAELRPLFDAAWNDLEDEDEDADGEERADPFASGLAMAELVTGLELTEDQVAAVLESDFFLAPSLRYPGAEAAEVEPAAPAAVKLERLVRKFDSGQVWTRAGLYMLTSSWDFSFEQEEPPEGASERFGLTVADHTAWVRTLTQHPITQVSLTVLSSPVEPTATLESLRAAYTDAASGVVLARTSGLHAIGDYGNRWTSVTDDEGTFALHVFARRGQAAEEEHVLVVWPATAG